MKYISKSKVTLTLWNNYTETSEFKVGINRSIDANHRLIILEEEKGLKDVMLIIENQLLKKMDIKSYYFRRSNKEWIEEWKKMHELLFQGILLENGNIRSKEERVYFASPEMEDLIPQTPGEIYQGLDEVADLIQNTIALLNSNGSRDQVLTAFAKVHHKFIITHPFADGNGRIGRVIVDQLCLLAGFPPAMGGYPRNDSKRREEYHEAILAGLIDNQCYLLSEWIRKYIENTENILS